MATKKKQAVENRETSAPNERQVRLKDYNPRSGHVLRTYMYRGIKFEDGKGWYTVPLSVAVYLQSVRNVFDDPNSPLAFDVATLEEAKGIAKVEWEEKVDGGRVKPGDTAVLKPRDTDDQIRPGVDPPPVSKADLTTADLRRRADATPPADRKTRIG